MAIKYLRTAPTDMPIRTPLAAQIRRDFGALVDPFLLHLPAPPVLAGVWMACRESELVGRVPRAAKEAVAASVSRLNRCPYCVDAHSVMLHAVDSHAAAVYLRTGHVGRPLDPALADMVAWAQATRSPGAAILRNPPFSPDEAPEIIGVAVFYHYINRMVSVLLDPSPIPSVPQLFTAPAARMAGWWFSLAARRPKSPGAALGFLPSAELPADLGWASAAPLLSHAFARFAAAVEAAGSQALDADVRTLVGQALAPWDGTPPPLGLAWLDPWLAELPSAMRPAGRIALLTALAPYQVHASTVAAFQQTGIDDSALIGALAWASFAAARRVGTWLSPG